MKNTLFITLVLYAMLFVISACEDIGAPANAEFTLPTVQLRIGCPITVSNTSTYLDNYEWNFGDGNTSIDRSPTHTYTTPGTYTVTLRVYDADTEDTHSVTVIVSAESSKFELVEADTGLGYNPTYASVALAYDGGYVTVANDVPDYYIPVTYLKADFDGNIAWKKTLSFPLSNLQIKDIVATLDGGHLMAGRMTYYGIPDYANVYSRSLLVKIDEKGDTLWTKYLGGVRNDAEALNAIVALPTGGYVVAGLRKYTTVAGLIQEDIFLAKVDANGSVQWKKTLGVDNRYEEAHDLALAPDGGYVMVGYTRTTTPARRLYLLKTHADGTKDWDNTLGDGDLNPNIIPASNSGYIIVNLGKLIKTDANGNMQWEKTFNGVPRAITSAPDGGYVMTGGNLTSGIGNVYLAKTDVNGNPVWEHNFAGSSWANIGYDIQATYDCGYIVSGRKDLESIYFIKTDEDGNAN